MASISEEHVPLAAEDRFLIVSIKEAQSLCPGGEDAAALGEAIQAAKPFLGNLTPLFDLRGLPQIYNDVDVFIDEVASTGSHVLVNPKTAKNLDLRGLTDRGLHVLNAKGHSYRARPFDLSNVRSGDSDNIFESFRTLADDMQFESGIHGQTIIGSLDEDDLNYGTNAPPSLEDMRRLFSPRRLGRLIKNCFPRTLPNAVRVSEFAQSIRVFLPQILRSFEEFDLEYGPWDVDDPRFYLQAALLHAFLRQLHRNSLLVEFVMSTDGESITCTPYHGAALHEIERPRTSDVLIGRPAVVARKTHALFSWEIEKLQRLLNEPSTRERHLQKFFEQHQNFLSGLSYTNVYPQLVLQREDGSQLRPDFILEPYDDMWCDILDIKLPNQPLIVGRRDRATLAAATHEVAAQLREYAAYFEEEKHRKFVRDKYGLRLYKPRLIAIVGRDIRQMTDPQIRRAMTAYNDVQVMTFDQLVRHAQSRMLL